MRVRHGLWLMADGMWKMAALFAIAMSLQPLAMAGCSKAPTAKPTARNLLLVTIDTLRADHVGRCFTKLSCGVMASPRPMSVDGPVPKFQRKLQRKSLSPSGGAAE